MRNTLFVLALLVAAPAFAATPSDAPALNAAVETATTEASPVVFRSSARLIIRTPVVVSATIALHDTNGEVVRAFKDHLLWEGETVLNLDLDGIPVGTYSLVVETSLGAQATEIVVA